MERAYIIAFVMAFSMLPHTALGQHTVEFSLIINNTDNTVYIPGRGEMSSSSLGSTTNYPNPPHFYLASYLSNLLTGIVAKDALNLFYGSDSSSHTLGIQQDSGDARIFIPATVGDWNNIDRRMRMIEKGKFLTEFSPSFGFPMSGFYYTVTIMLRYSGINLTGDPVLGKGRMKLRIENLGEHNGTPVVSITR